MEVNVDTLEQVELIDLGDQDGADVFLPCEDPPPTPQTSGRAPALGTRALGRGKNTSKGLEVMVATKATGACIDFWQLALWGH